MQQILMQSQEPIGSSQTQSNSQITDNVASTQQLNIIAGHAFPVQSQFFNESGQLVQRYEVQEDSYDQNKRQRSKSGG